MSPSHRTADDMVLDALHSMRTLVGMEVAFISQFKDGRRIFRYVDPLGSDVPIHVGGSDALEDSYCQRVIDGRLPELIQDAMQLAEARKLPATAAVPVGAHLSVPIRLSDGGIYGTFCCFSRAANCALNARDIDTMRCFADITAKFIERQVAEEKRREVLLARHTAVLKAESFAIVYQPIVHIADSQVAGYEALTRFLAEPVRTPDVWFEEAAEIGLQQTLELAVIAKALHNLNRLPEDIYVSINASPATVLSGALDEALSGYPCERLMLEVTEHSSVNDYAQVVKVLKPLRRRGLRLAVDDAGAGFASFRHILELKPDVIKLDTSLIRQIDTDTGQRALAAALVRFAQETGSQVVAEGVETEAELAILRELSVDKVQGYLLGRPAPIETFLSGRVA
ncbi:MAG: EAL domain-containing protein [Proteobacteria bacterium]|nr:EAL domain-containing protein [Pseudomonadota bacterium]